jgi:hypothetical protein
MLFAPEANERFLHDVFGIGDGLDELSREKHEARRDFAETNFPIFINGDIVHDLFTVFH